MRPRRPPRRKRSLILAAVTALAVTWPGAAWADDAWDDDEGPLDDRAFDYTTAAKRNYARGFLEEDAVDDAGRLRGIMTLEDLKNYEAKWREPVVGQ